MSLIDLHIGIDDTDSPLGFCTTFLALILADKLREAGATFSDLPYLIRLNPNVPAKTRGNGAVSLHFKLESYKIKQAENIIRATTNDFTEKHAKTDPAVVILAGEVPSSLRQVFQRALSEYLPASYVHSLVKRDSLNGKIRLIYARRDAPRGIVGAISAIAAYPLKEYTYELLVYRDLKEKESTRRISPDVFLRIDRRLRPIVFSTFDHHSKRLLAVPHGPDPVLFGLRSLDASVLLKVAEEISSKIKFLGYVVFKTNQATNMHLRVKKRVAFLRPYDSAIIQGNIRSRPKITAGGHTFVEVCDDTGCVTVAFFKETGRLNRVARLLQVGDMVEVGGGVIPRERITFNAEILRVIKVSPLVMKGNPRCPSCGTRMTSAGHNKGYKCPRCGFRSTTLEKEVKILPRMLEPGIYVQSPAAFRHLTRPQEIYGLHAAPLSGDWLSTHEWFKLRKVNSIGT
jgi:tRNA(Ile2)-agmatinylcytidine synthase